MRSRTPLKLSDHPLLWVGLHIQGREKDKCDSRNDPERGYCISGRDENKKVKIILHLCLWRHILHINLSELPATVSFQLMVFTWPLTYGVRRNVY